MKRKSSKVVFIIVIILVLALVAGTTYAYWKITKVQPEDANKISATCLNLALNTVEGTPQKIDLQSHFPITDEEAQTLTGYTFQIENKCDTYVKYDINLESLVDSTISESDRLNLNYLDAILNDDEIKQISTYPTTDSALAAKDGTAYDTRKLKTDTIAPGSKENPAIKKYTLKVWMDEDVVSEDAMNKTWTGKISIVGRPALVYADASKAEVPELNKGLIPVTWNGSSWVKADVTTKWYDYDAQWWANAVTVTNEKREGYISAAVNTPIKMSDIETMWVWVPRYEYQHTNLSTQYAGETSAAAPGAITINFISKETTTPSSDNFTIHDAFWWDDNNNGTKDAGEQLSGIWVAKFEMSVPNATSNTLQAPIIKPNVTSWRNAQIATFWTSIHQYMNGSSNQYGLTDTDAHLMKNMEWGSAAYLSQSKYGKYGNSNYTGANKEVAINNCSNFITGIGGDTVSAPSSSTTCTTNTYETAKGQAASTTGNIYGIYDMSGGAWEHVMGIQKLNGLEEPSIGFTESYLSGWNGKLYNKTEYTGSSYGYLYGANGIGTKYYDLYDYGADSTATSERRHLGDATYEVAGWYQDNSLFINTIYSYFCRGGYYENQASAGIFTMRDYMGVADSVYSGRPVLVKVQ